MSSNLSVCAMRIMITCILVYIFLFSYVLAENPIVETHNGNVMGKIRTTRAGVEFYSFTEIPYAKPPIGRLRFKPPLPVENWNGTLDCTKSSKICYQLDENSAHETEDCLNLNIYTPVCPDGNASLAVIFYIFGGAFINGDATFRSHGPHYLMEHDVVVVTVNYRIGAFGFLSTNDKYIPGNMGLKDQLLALKWVQKNIYLFGGDPDRVTLYGMSAGSAAVTYHVLSKQSKGLFSAAIGESGSALCPWAYQRYARKIAFQLGQHVDKHFQSPCSKDLLEFLQSRPAREIDRMQGKIHLIGQESMESLFGWFEPVIEPEDVEGAFTTERMYGLLEKGDFNRVPMMLGIASEEMLFMIGETIYYGRYTGRHEIFDRERHRSVFYARLFSRENRERFRKFMDYLDRNLSEIVPPNLHIKNKTELEEVGIEIRSILTNGSFQEHTAESIRYFSDTMFNRPIIKNILMHSVFADAYFFIFSYHGSLTQNINPYFVNGAEYVSHSEYSHYVWVKDNLDLITEYSYPDKVTSDRYLTFLTNFAKYSNPTPECDNLLENLTWPKLEKEEFYYMDFNYELNVTLNPKMDTFKKWVNLYERRGVKPFDTY